MFLDQFAKRDSHFFFDIAGAVHMAGDAEQLRACVASLAKGREPVRSAPQDGRGNGNRFNIVHCRRAAIKAGTCREWRLQARLALLALQRFDQRCLLAADIGAGTAMKIDIELPAGFRGIVAKKAGIIGLVDADCRRRASFTNSPRI